MPLTNLIQVTCFYNTIEKWLSEIYEEAEIEYNDEWRYIPNEWNHRKFYIPKNEGVKKCTARAQNL